MERKQKLLFIMFLILTVTTKVTQNGPITCQACLQGLGTYCLGMITAGKYIATKHISSKKLYSYTYKEYFFMFFRYFLASKCSALAWFPPLWCKCILGVVGIGCGVGMIACGASCFIPTL